MIPSTSGFTFRKGIVTGYFHSSPRENRANEVDNGSRL